MEDPRRLLFEPKGGFMTPRGGHLFISYCRDEGRWLQEIKINLKPLLRGRAVEIWDDTRIGPGSDWEAEIDGAIAASGVALLLVSQRFLASDFIHEKELPKLLKAARDGAMRVFPIAVSTSSYSRSPLHNIQALNDVKAPLDSLSLPQLNAELVRIAETIADLFDQPPAAGTPPSRLRELRYLDGLVKEMAAKAAFYSSLRGLAQVRAAQPAVSQRHVKWNGDAEVAVYLKHAFRQKQEQVPRPPPQHFDEVLRAFDQLTRAVVLGDPGGGKSTTLRKLAMDLAERAMGDAQAAVPVFADLAKWTGDEPLMAFVGRFAEELDVPELARAGRLILLLDSLNEMPLAKRVGKVREIQAVGCAAMFVSCRKEDYGGELDLGLDRLTLEPLSPQRVQAALRQWVGVEEEADRLFWQLTGNERTAEVFGVWMAAGATEEEFWTLEDPSKHEAAYRKTTPEQDKLFTNHVANPRTLLRLAANPFLLTMLYQVWQLGEGVLPRNRADLFDGFIQCLLGREGLLQVVAGGWEATPDGERLVAGLTDLAWSMGSERTVIPRREAETALAGLLKKALETTVLEGGDELRFRHQLLQEYFTARALRMRLGSMSASELWPGAKWWERSGWEETAVLLAGFHGADCTPVIEWLMEAQPEVAAKCLLESGAEVKDRAGLLERLRGAWEGRLLGPELAVARAAIGRALGRLGLDCRRGVGVRADGVPDIDWVEIPAGTFVYQEEKTRRRNERFRMARYPVTNAQFEAFVKAEDGYRDDRWWVGLDGADRGVRPGYFDEPNHPRETVSWYEAMAFCGWLGHRLGMVVRLPTEEEWERAARGGEGREYPWGDGFDAERANTWEGRIGATAAVGIYANGASAESVLDLSGNVWEWCLNEYTNPKRTQRGGMESRVLRGGAWFDRRDGARAVVRDGSRPLDRYLYVGFRVVGE